MGLLSSHLPSTSFLSLLFHYLHPLLFPHTLLGTVYQFNQPCVGKRRGEGGHVMCIIPTSSQYCVFIRLPTSARETSLSYHCQLAAEPLGDFSLLISPNKRAALRCIERGFLFIKTHSEQQSKPHRRMSSGGWKVLHLLRELNIKIKDEASLLYSTRGQILHYHFIRAFWQYGFFNQRIQALFIHGCIFKKAHKIQRRQSPQS